MFKVNNKSTRIALAEKILAGYSLLVINGYFSSYLTTFNNKILN